MLRWQLCCLLSTLMEHVFTADVDGVWRRLNNDHRIYFFSHGDTLRIQHARENCMSRDAQLVVLNSEEENRAVNARRRHDRAFFIGLYYQDGEPLQWFDGSYPSYLKLKGKPPDDKWEIRRLFRYPSSSDDRWTDERYYKACPDLDWQIPSVCVPYNSCVNSSSALCWCRCYTCTQWWLICTKRANARRNFTEFSRELLLHSHALHGSLEAVSAVLARLGATSNYNFGAPWKMKASRKCTTYKERESATQINLPGKLPKALIGGGARSKSSCRSWELNFSLLVLIKIVKFGIQQSINNFSKISSTSTKFAISGPNIFVIFKWISKTGVFSAVIYYLW